MLQRMHRLVALSLVMAVSLAFVIVTGTIALILNGKASGNIVAWIADGFAWSFSLAFFGAFTLAMIEQRRREAGENIQSRSGDATRQIQPRPN
jgi:hypothetical protein